MRFASLTGFLLLFLLNASGQPKTYSIIFLDPRHDALPLDATAAEELRNDHLENIIRLSDEGKLLIAGPFRGGGELIVMNTSSTDEALTWMENDLTLRADRWRVEALPFTPRIGSICPVRGEVNYVEYAFVRFNAIVEKFNASSYPNLIREHEKFISSNFDRQDIVAEGVFGPNEGGILVLRTAVSNDTFLPDPAVQQGLIDVDIKVIHIARSSFCEP